MPSERRDWNRLEVEAVVESYLRMLLLELTGKSYNKTAYRHELQKLLHNRTDFAIEKKHQNISAILIELGLPYISGYKPLVNYQILLYEVIEKRVYQAPELISSLIEGIDRSIEIPAIGNILETCVDPPFGIEKSPRQYVRENKIPSQLNRPNYLLKEASNTMLGRAGEEYVLNYERARLLAERKDSLASKIEHVSRVRDYEGFDILSFETNGKERLIEVKTTGFGIYTPFYISSNELFVSQKERDSYYLYRVFEFRKRPQLFMKNGSLDHSFELNPTQYIARI